MNLNGSSSTLCINMNEYLWEQRKDLTTRISIMLLIGIVYICIITAALIGNLCVVLAVARTRSLQTVQNMFLVSLSCSDIVVCTTSGTVTPITAFAKNWLFGSELCYLAPLLSGVSLCFSAFTLAAIAIDRFILIIFPTRPSINSRQAIVIILIIVLISCSLSFPMMLKQRLDSFAGFCGLYCTEQWGKDIIGRRAYGTVMVGLQYCLPLIIIAFSYTAISIRLNQSLILKNQDKSIQLTEQQRSAITRRQRTNRMLIAMVLAFAISYSFNIAFNVLRDYDQLPIWVKKQEYLYGIVTHCIAISGTIWNPFLYAWLNVQLRTAFLQQIPTFILKSIGINTNASSTPQNHTADRYTPTIINGQSSATAAAAIIMHHDNSAIISTNIDKDCYQWTKLISSGAVVAPCSRRQFGDSIRAITGRYGALQDEDRNGARLEAETIFVKEHHERRLRKKRNRAMSLSQQQRAMTRFHRQRSKSMLVRSSAVIIDSSQTTSTTTIVSDDDTGDNTKVDNIVDFYSDDAI